MIQGFFFAFKKTPNGHPTDRMKIEPKMFLVIGLA